MTRRLVVEALYKRGLLPDKKSRLIPRLQRPTLKTPPPARKRPAGISVEPGCYRNDEPSMAAYSTWPPPPTLNTKQHPPMTIRIPIVSLIVMLPDNQC